MNKDDLVKKIADIAGVTKAQALDCWSACFDSISEALISGDIVKISGFGSFQVGERKEKNGRNPRTGEEILIPASKRVVFKMSDVMKNKINS
ncbi:HU family DNA-binding protein [Candidatus Gromoviella agglomerans]|uniref:HU family DNA-binding protein n=1 Tax=Candidatus Gromoviella agglomerans TaxID=2806609 RepID=UPI001E35FCAD|nr:HU family DNA-binding protein [Candidatus Gromoviella agglomerans]UFX98472.1 HU family DNA-binding protein [Candidatus Gromoviella agglomerans]